MSKLEYHYETIGRVLKYLIDHGLRRVDLDGSNARDIIDKQGSRQDEWEVEVTFNDVMYWMIDEGLLRTRGIQGSDDCDIFNGVQLTSKGLAVIKSHPVGEGLEGSVEEILSTKKKAELSADTYTKIGSLIGGGLGGLIKSIGG